jgi:adenylate cyclase
LSKRAQAWWTSLAAAALGLAIMQSGLWRQVELKLYDLLVVHTAPNKVELPITIVGIDEATFTELKSGWPLARGHHARLLDNLAEAGVAVVGFDIRLPEASKREDDDAFAQAIQRFGHVVLAADYGVREDSAVRQWSRIDPYPLFLLAGASSGFAPLTVDPDAVLRRVPSIQDAFWRVVLARFDAARPGIVSSLEVAEDQRIRYLGGARTFTYVPYHHLLDPERHLPGTWRDFFRDNIVLVGRNIHVIEEVGSAEGEVVQTPFFAQTKEFMPRVEAHANLIANMAAGEVLREAPAWWALALWAACALGAMALMRNWHPVVSGVALAAVIATVAGVEYYAFTRWSLWLPAAGAALTAALIYAGNGALAFYAEQKQRREIRGAFSKYVSEALVDEMIAHPERLKLGGERRVVTVLFSDLAGFTSVSEGLEPEQVGALMNRHFTDMTDAIMERKGTVDKFLGDGLMAFWGAPLADEKQSERAVLASIEMQRRMLKMNADLGTRLGMRIGIHRGECIVGNMGSAKRFDYSAMGDTTNLASRLEGANKAYGTPILASETVVAAAGDALKFREIDAIRVKGKAIGVRVFTPCDDPALIALSAEALAAWREGQFGKAGQAWLRLLQAYPDDPVAKVFLERLQALQKRPASADWDSTATLTEK